MCGCRSRTDQLQLLTRVEVPCRAGAKVPLSVHCDSSGRCHTLKCSLSVLWPCEASRDSDVLGVCILRCLCVNHGSWPWALCVGRLGRPISLPWIPAHFELSAHRGSRSRCAGVLVFRIWFSVVAARGRQRMHALSAANVLQWVGDLLGGQFLLVLWLNRRYWSLADMPCWECRPGTYPFLSCTEPPGCTSGAWGAFFAAVLVQNSVASLRWTPVVCGRSRRVRCYGRRCTLQTSRKRRLSLAVPFLFGHNGFRLALVPSMRTLLFGQLATVQLPAHTVMRRTVKWLPPRCCSIEVLGCLRRLPSGFLVQSVERLPRSTGHRSSWALWAVGWYPTGEERTLRDTGPDPAVSILLPCLWEAASPWWLELSLGRLSGLLVSRHAQWMSLHFVWDQTSLCWAVRLALRIDLGMPWDSGHGQQWLLPWCCHSRLWRSRRLWLPLPEVSQSVGASSSEIPPARSWFRTASASIGIFQMAC